MMQRISVGFVLAAVGSSLLGCSQSPAPADTQPGGTQPGVKPAPAPDLRGATPMTLPQPMATSAAFLALKATLAAGPQTAAQLAQAHAVSFLDKVPYDPGAAVGMARLQGSALALTPADLTALGGRGFVIADRSRFANFIHGYKAIYAEHLPVYVSADSILYAVHRSYDAILRTLEERTLIPRLSGLLHGMQRRLAATPPAGASATARADADVYLAVAVALLDGSAPVTMAGGDQATAAGYHAKATAVGGGQEDVEIFGTRRLIDYSQFQPRGHYTRSPELSRYFRAMIWLGRTELRIIETKADGSQVFRRRQLEGAVLLRALIDGPALVQWQSIDKVVRAFVGEPDDMSVPDIDAYLAAVGATTPGDLAGKSDEALARAIVDGNFGSQRIASQIMVNGTDEDTLPLHRSFLVFGQRYVIDSHVFSNVVYDRVKHASVKRMMPATLDMAFAALGNDAATPLLAAELGRYDYASELGAMRTLADAHGADHWGSNLYNLWLSALRALSPPRELKGTGMEIPSVARTEGWSRRILNTQLASWAELRHDTLLYTKQSYTSTPACEYPDAYVEPYPAFWERLAAFGKTGLQLVSGLGLDAAMYDTKQMTGYFTKVEEVATLLGDMAVRQGTGQPFTAAQLAFVNQAVSLVPYGCVQQTAAGWYAELFFDPSESINFDPTIADVHTQPADEGGNPVGRVLHVGTGRPRLMVITVDTCADVRAYVGLASAYYEKITKDWKRLTDPEWAMELDGPPPPEVDWQRDLISR